MTRRRRASAVTRRVGAVASLLAPATAVVAWSCGGEPRPGSDGKPRPGSDGERRELTVFAASSLAEAFQELALGFERRRPELDVVLAFAGSQVLRLQIEHGAAAHVFASADMEHARALAEIGLMTTPRVFATNALAVIVPGDNPARIESFGDLPRAQRLVLGVAAVPVGAYARQALSRAAVHYGATFEASALARVVSHENSARLARTRVEMGEADAAIVYRTDAVAAGALWAHGDARAEPSAAANMRAMPVPASLGVRAEYGIAVAVQAAVHADAEAWVEFVLSAEGRRVLIRRGFGAPRPGAEDRP